MDTLTLKVVVDHSVKDVETHYIDKLIVKLNDETIITQVMEKQTGKDKLELIYILPDAAKGDKIEIKTYCNVSGALKKEFVVKEKKAEK